MKYRIFINKAKIYEYYDLYMSKNFVASHYSLENLEIDYIKKQVINNEYDMLLVPTSRQMEYEKVLFEEFDDEPNLEFDSYTIKDALYKVDDKAYNKETKTMDIYVLYNDYKRIKNEANESKWRKIEEYLKAHPRYSKNEHGAIIIKKINKDNCDIEKYVQKRPKNCNKNFINKLFDFFTK